MQCGFANNSMSITRMRITSLGLQNCLMENADAQIKGTDSNCNSLNSFRSTCYV
jgi:hypothetical protein